MADLLDDESARRSSARQDRQILANGNEAPIYIEAEVSAQYYLASAHRSPVRGLRVTNLALPPAAGSDELVLTCHVESALGESLFEPRALAFPLPAQGLSIPFQTFQLNPNRRVLAMLDERIQAHLVLTIRRGDQVVGSLRKPIEFLAHNQWMYEDSYFDSLAAFVHPNSRTIDSIISRARVLLEHMTGDGSTEGYQSVGSQPERVHQMAAAVFDALRELKLAYTDPPTGFEGYGQKIRTPEVVMAEAAATCIDSAVLYVSCLLRIGLRAQIVMIRGHALASYWSTDDPQSWAEEQLYTSVMRDMNVFDQVLQDGFLKLVETTTFTATHDRSFREAQHAGRQRCGNSRVFKALIDVEASISNGVVPLPPRELVLQGGDLEPVEVERWVASGAARAQQPGSAPEGEVSGDYLEPTAHPPRVAAWLRSLLDLSYANPLIRMRRSSRSVTVLDLELPLGLVGRAEDRLMGQGSLLIRSGAEAPGALMQDPDNFERYLDDLAQSGTLYFPSPSKVRNEQDAFFTHARQENPEEAIGYLTRKVLNASKAYFADRLDKAMRGLKRRANDLEQKSGSNNLFLCIGELRWTAEDGKSGAAPLFLIPIRIAGSARQGYKVTPDDSAEVMPNYALMEKLRLTYGLQIDALERPLNDDAGVDVDRLLSGVRESLAGARIQGANVVESMSIAVLDFSSFRLWRDLNDHWEEFLKSPVLHHLVHTPSADFVEPGGALELSAPILCPIEADESQMEAITNAVKGQTFVLEGPPGTGKSQTITNLLAASIAAGKKVLFVAEKSAALDVVRKRLDSVGLGPLCLELFDKEAKPDHIKAQIQEALDLQPPDHGAEWDEILGRLQADERRLREYRDAIHEPGANDQTLWDAYQEVIRLGEGPVAELPQDFLTHLAADRSKVIEALLDLPRVVGTPVVDSRHPWSLSTKSVFTAVDPARLLWSVQTLSWSRAVIQGQSQQVTQLLDCAHGPDEYEQAASAIESLRSGPSLTAEELAVVGTPPWLAASQQAVAGVEAFLLNLKPLLDIFLPSVLSNELAAATAAGQVALTAGVLTRSRATREFRAELLPFLVDPNADQPVPSLVAALQQLPEIRAQWSAAHHSLLSIPGLRLPPTWSVLDPASLELAKSQLEALPNIASASESAIARMVVSTPHTEDGLNELIQALRGAASAWQVLVSDLAADAESIQRWTATRSLSEAWAAAEPSWNADVPRFLQLQRWSDILLALKPLRDAGLTTFSDQILAGEVDVDEADSMFRRAVAKAVVAERTLASGLDRFDGHAHNRVLDDFAERFERRRTLMNDRIPSELVQHRPMSPGKRIGKWGELERHLTAQRRKISIRRLMEDYGQFVGDLTPCFLMSPDSVARFIPPGSITFDLVVFDEASQIEVPRAAGALGRARAAVIVGDTKQMPPSKFGGTQQDDGDGSDDDTLEITDLESLLEECRASRLPTYTLQCHYRSRHEALIAFSNHHFYDDKLTTFPSPADTQEAPIGWRRIDGRFRRSKQALPEDWDEDAEPWPVGTNLIEARAVVDEIVSRLSDPARKHESIGVVTSNQFQRELIRDLLYSESDPLITELLERDNDTSLLVQNLESVQGDERDVFLMSIGFAPPVSVASDGSQQRKTLPMNFGPLNRKGGERRLNVAVTRARSEMIVFCSFEPEEMTIKSESPRGIQLLHAYLVAARDGATRSGDVVARIPHAPDRHRAEIASELRSRGYHVQEDVGLSQFRVDLAIGLPGDDGYSVAVLLDGPIWADRSFVYDRDVLPQAVLTGLMGWSEVIRLWLPMWIHAREEVLTEIEEAVRRSSPGAAPRGQQVSDAEPVSTPPPIPVDMEIPEFKGSLPSTPSLPNPETHPLSDPLPPQHLVQPPVAAEPPEPIQRGTGNGDIFGTDTPVFVDDLPVGSPEARVTLDALPDPAARLAVQQVVLGILGQLSPIDHDGLCRLVAGQFGLGRCSAERISAISATIPAGLVRTSDFGKFVWRSDLDPDTWEGFRRNRSDTKRRLGETPPEEIRNAMVECVRQGVEIRGEELFRIVSALFGTTRMTATATKRLSLVAAWAVATGRLIRTPDGSYRFP